ncbi:ATPase [Estrella lausannensis]|uniref:ATPase n=2 Tax=Estrella lausannensis TaxID=483423 RepID=A0A0H5DR40_9BACT|nr:ATPase [Estrella lausannensis]
MKRHALLVGPSRVGKSLTAKAFAQAIERGDYPFLSGKTVFRINTADLVGHQASFLGGGNTILNKISDAMGRFRGDIILVLDEVHMACKEGEKLADQLKPFLDENGDFVHVIGITTEDEYRHVRENNAFALRFDCIPITNTSKEETVQLLADMALTNAAHPLLQEGVLDFIVDADRDAVVPQPATALKRLKKCITQVEKGQMPDHDAKMEILSRKIRALRSRLLVAAGSLDESRAKLAKLKRKLKAREAKVALKRGAVERLYREKEKFIALKDDFYRAALKIGPLAGNTIGSAERANINRLSLMRRFLLPAYFSYLERESKELKVPLVIDKQLASEVFASDNH